MLGFFANRTPPNPTHPTPQLTETVVTALPFDLLPFVTFSTTKTQILHPQRLHLSAVEETVVKVSWRTPTFPATGRIAIKCTMDDSYQELHALALRMRREMQCKERYAQGCASLQVPT